MHEPRAQLQRLPPQKKAVEIYKHWSDGDDAGAKCDVLIEDFWQNATLAAVVFEIFKKRIEIVTLD